jgi:hypothetical protein
VEPARDGPDAGSGRVGQLPASDHPGDGRQRAGATPIALGAPLFAANAGVWSNTNDDNAFVTPMEANGRVYVPAYKTVTVSGLTQ